ncbi:MAG: serine/threonine-protein kinase [Pseudomonadota bacterium]
MTDSDGDPFSTGAGLGILSELSPGETQDLVGRELDGYRISGFIAEGGMSRVYRASRIDGSFERDVAIKLSAVSGFSPTMRERFTQEQSVLASLNHPHISQLYDARLTAEGWPYIVMELVEGSPITAYCRDRRLSLEDRVRLLIDVVDAVSFAHANLVVHRDIKPSNVLVSDDGRVKLLDFGIAKLLQDDSGELTRAGAMTPQYASPEQLLGQPISIASDVYQLGLLAAEVLAGSLPTEGETLTDAIQRSADGRPVTLPSDSRQALPRDVTVIIERCLRADAADRYRDANSLGRDLEAYLTGYPVAAVGGQAGDRFRKFVQRNRGSVLGAFLTLVALVSATVITGLQMLEAQKQRDIAVYQQQRSQATNEFYSLLMEEMGNGEFTSVELLDRGKTLLEDQFGSGQSFMASVLFDVSRRYSALGERQREAELLDEAERIAREFDDSDLLAAVVCKKARNNQYRDADLATERLTEGLRLFESLGSPSIQTSVECLRAKSGIQVKDRDLDAAMQTLLQIRTLLEEHPAPGTSLKGPILNDIALMHYQAGRLDESIGILEEILALLDATGRGGTLGYQRVAGNRAAVLNNMGRAPEALEAFADVTERMRASGFQGRGASAVLAQYGDLLMSVGRTADAERVFTEGLTVAEAGGASRHTAFLNVGLAKVGLANEDYDAVLARLDLAEQQLALAPRADPTLSASIRILRIKVYRNSGDLDTAARDIEALLVDTGFPDTVESPGMVSALIEGTEVHRRRGDYERAIVLIDGLVERMQGREQGADKGSVHLGRALVQRAEIRLETDDPQGAAADLEMAVPNLVYALGDEHRDVEAARQLLSQALERGAT